MYHSYFHLNSPTLQISFLMLFLSLLLLDHLFWTWLMFFTHDIELYVISYFPSIPWQLWVQCSLVCLTLQTDSLHLHRMFFPNISMSGTSFYTWGQLKVTGSRLWIHDLLDSLCPWFHDVNSCTPVTWLPPGSIPQRTFVLKMMQNRRRGHQQRWMKKITETLNIPKHKANHWWLPRSLFAPSILKST